MMIHLEDGYRYVLPPSGGQLLNQEDPVGVRHPLFDLEDWAV
jgi:hypothetical protein